jgi:hypothetical protein
MLADGRCRKERTIARGYGIIVSKLGALRTSCVTCTAPGVISSNIRIVRVAIDVAHDEAARPRE